MALVRDIVNPSPDQSFTDLLDADVVFAILNKVLRRKVVGLRRQHAVVYDPRITLHRSMQTFECLGFPHRYQTSFYHIRLQPSQSARK